MKPSFNLPPHNEEYGTWPGPGYSKFGNVTEPLSTADRNSSDQNIEPSTEQEPWTRAHIESNCKYTNINRFEAKQIDLERIDESL